jgi:uncharacterized protein (TIGR03067 family)
MVEAELAGEVAPGLVAQKIEVELSAGSYYVRFGGQIVDRGTYVVAENHRHRTLMLTGTEGPNAGRDIPSIYELTGKNLRICYGLDRVTPDNFATAAGTQRYLARYRRKTP